MKNYNWIASRCMPSFCASMSRHRDCMIRKMSDLTAFRTVLKAWKLEVKYLKVTLVPMILESNTMIEHINHISWLLLIFKSQTVLTSFWLEPAKIFQVKNKCILTSPPLFLKMKGQSYSYLTELGQPR